MAHRMLHVARHWVLAALWVSPLAVGVGSGCGQAYDVCEVVCECTKCSDRARDDCELAVDRMVDVAAAYDCVDDMDGYVDCLITDSDCPNTSFDASDCAKEFGNLAECIDDASDIINFGSVGAGNQPQGGAGGTPQG